MGNFYNTLTEMERFVLFLFLSISASYSRFQLTKEAIANTVHIMYNPIK